MFKFFLYLFPAFGFTIFIGFLCFTPGNQLPKLDIFVYDKAGHLALFAVLVFLYSWGLQKQKNYIKLKQYAVPITLIFCIVYGISIEIIQEYLIPYRSGEYMDAMADSLGCFLGWGSYYLLKKFEIYLSKG